MTVTGDCLEVFSFSVVQSPFGFANVEIPTGGNNEKINFIPETFLFVCLISYLSYFVLFVCFLFKFYYYSC